MATNTEKPNAPNPPQENPNKTLDLTVPLSTKPDPDLDQQHPNPTDVSSVQRTPSDATSPPAAAGKESGNSKATVATVDSVAGQEAPLSDIQKKMRRAERFGISVQLSEQEKRNSRAERFGTGLPASQATETEQLKRKARAERFGIPTPYTPAEEEEKKKARLARFAPVLKVDPLEEDKRKARAARFQTPQSSSLSQVNGKGNIEPKEAIAGKAGGGA